MGDAGDGERREGWLLVRVHVPELNVHKCLQFPADQLVWDVKQQCLAALPKVSRIIKTSANTNAKGSGRVSIQNWRHPGI